MVDRRDVNQMGKEALRQEVIRLREQLDARQQGSTESALVPDLGRKQRALQLPPDSLITVAEAIENANTAARNQMMLDSQAYPAVNGVEIAMGVVQAVLPLPLFPGTAQLLSNVNAQLIKQIELLEDKLAELARMPGVTVNKVDTRQFIDLARNLHFNVKLLLQSNTITNEKLEKLREYVKNDFNPQIAAIYDGVTYSKPGAKKKDEDWLTVEAERLLADGYTEDQTAARIIDRLLEQQERRALTKSEEKALKALTESKNPAEMLGRRLRRKYEKKADKTILSAQE